MKCRLMLRARRPTWVTGMVGALAAPKETMAPRSAMMLSSKPMEPGRSTSTI